MRLLLNENMCSQSFSNVNIAIRIYLSMAVLKALKFGCTGFFLFFVCFFNFGCS